MSDATSKGAVSYRARQSSAAIPTSNGVNVSVQREYFWIDTPRDSVERSVVVVTGDASAQASSYSAEWEFVCSDNDRQIIRKFVHHLGDARDFQRNGDIEVSCEVSEWLTLGWREVRGGESHGYAVFRKDGCEMRATFAAPTSIFSLSSALR